MNLNFDDIKDPIINWDDNTDLVRLIIGDYEIPWDVVVRDYKASGIKITNFSYAKKLVKQLPSDWFTSIICTFEDPIRQFHGMVSDEELREQGYGHYIEQVQNPGESLHYLMIVALDLTNNPRVGPDIEEKEEYINNIEIDGVEEVVMDEENVITVFIESK